MTAPTEHPRRALPAAGASDRGASSPSPGRAKICPHHRCEMYLEWDDDPHSWTCAECEEEAISAAVEQSQMIEW